MRLKVQKEAEVVDSPADSLARAKVLLEAKTHGQRCVVGKGGCAFNCKDVMVAMELGNRRALVIAMEKDEKKRVDHSAAEAKALEFLEKEEPINECKKENLDALLEWKGTVFTNETGNVKAKSLKIKEKQDFWLTVKDKPCVSLKKCSDNNEKKTSSFER